MTFVRRLSASKHAVAAISLACLFSAGPALADYSFTGCLTPGGALINLAPGLVPLKNCARSHMEVTIGASGSGGFSDWEIVEAEDTSGTVLDDTKTVTANCPAGKKVLGGGGDAQAPQTFKLAASYPLSGGAGWETLWINTGGPSLSHHYTYAICATVD